MNNLEYIEANIFLVSLTIGLVFSYLIIKQPKIIIRFPNLENYKDTIYLDDLNKKYKYEKQKINIE